MDTKLIFVVLLNIHKYTIGCKNGKHNPTKLKNRTPVEQVGQRSHINKQKTGFNNETNQQFRRLTPQPIF